jgi:hypothetical protein
VGINVEAIREIKPIYVGGHLLLEVTYKDGHTKKWVGEIFAPIHDPHS